jgi:hypothetical protein
VLVGPTDSLPHQPWRVAVASTSGSGKTTFAARMAAVLQAAHVEIDSLFHGPAWTPRPSFETDVPRFNAQPKWVTEWQYGSVRAHPADRAPPSWGSAAPTWSHSRVRVFAPSSVVPQTAGMPWPAVVGPRSVSPCAGVRTHVLVR